MPIASLLPHAGVGSQSIVVTGLTRTKTVGSITLAQEQLVAVSGLTRTKTVGTIRLAQEQGVAVTGLTRTKTIGTIVLAQERLIAINGLSRSKTIGVIRLSNGGIVVLAASSLTDVIFQRLNPIYGEGSEVSFHLWMRDKGYKFSDLPSVFGKTADETINDAAYRWFRTGYTP